MSRVQREHYVIRNRVTQIKLVRADDVTFRADPKQFAFDRIEVVSGINFFGEDGVE